MIMGLSLPTNIFRKEELPSSSLYLKAFQRVSCLLVSPINTKQEKVKQAKYYRGDTIMIQLASCFRWLSMMRVLPLFSHWEGKVRDLPKVTPVRMYTVGIWIQVLWAQNRNVFWTRLWLPPNTRKADAAGELSWHYSTGALGIMEQGNLSALGTLGHCLPGPSKKLAFNGCLVNA